MEGDLIDVFFIFIENVFFISERRYFEWWNLLFFRNFGVVGFLCLLG